jgi:hypothetical protein
VDKFSFSFNSLAQVRNAAADAACSVTTTVMLVKFKNVEVKVTLGLVKERPHDECIWGSGGLALQSLTLAVDGGEWSASCPCRFTSKERYFWYPLRRRLDIKEKKKRN